ncbi:hypothetical protein IV102_32700 [bacterium]|nr:hypothetical protein [bacterium]
MLQVDLKVTPRPGLSRMSPVQKQSPKEVAPQDGYMPGSLPERIRKPEISAPPTEIKGPSGWKKAVLGGSLALSAFTGLAPTAQAAIAAVQMQPRSATNGMDVTVLPSGTPRLDIFTAGKHGIDRDVDPDNYSQVGLSLGNGLFQDTEGNLSVVPFMSYGWNLEARDFQRYGQTVQYTPSSTKREIYSEAEKSVTLTGSHGTTVFTRQQDGSLTVKSPHDEYTIKSDGMFIRILQEGKQDISILRSGDEIRVLEGQRTFAASSLKDGVITIKSQNGEATVTRSESGIITNIDGRNGFKDAKIIKDGNTFLGIKDRDRMSVNDRALLDQAKARYDEVMAQLEAVEPGFEQKHPLIAEVLEYAAANPRLLTQENDGVGFLQAGTLLSTTGGAAETVSALGSQAAAMSLANSARALGAAALSAKAAAQAQAAAGNLAQAASLAKDAQNLATRAHEAKDAAVKTGGKAMKSAQLARMLMGVGGALEIVDGVLDYKGGKSDRSLVEGARAVTQSSMDQLAGQMQNSEDRLAVQDDYDKVMKVMDELGRQADKKVTVGKLKVGLGGLMVVSALLGPEMPPILAAIGLAGSVAVPVYEHWGPIKSFLTGDSNKVPTFLDILPQSDEVIIHLDGKPLKRK